MPEDRSPRSNAKPIISRSEYWPACRSPDDVSAEILKAFSGSRYKVRVTGSEVEITTGSKTLYRLWGELIPWGQNNAPVGLELTIRLSSQGSEVEAYAFDRFGWRITDKTFFGAEKTFEAQIDHLIKKAQTASEA
jgi:hypothetical protein